MPSSDQLWGEDLQLDAPTLARLSQLEAASSSASSSSSSSHQTRMSQIASASAAALPAPPGPSSPSNASLSRLTRRLEETRGTQDAPTFEDEVDLGMYDDDEVIANPTVYRALDTITREGRGRPAVPPYQVPLAPRPSSFLAPSPPLPRPPPSGPFMDAVRRYNPIPNARLQAAAGPSNLPSSTAASDGSSSVSSSRTISPELLQLRPPPAPRLEHPRPSLSPEKLPGRIKRPRLRRESSSDKEEVAETRVASGSRSQEQQPRINVLPSFPISSTSTSAASTIPNLFTILSKPSTSPSTRDKGKGKARASPTSIANPSPRRFASSSSSIRLQPKPEPSTTIEDDELLLLLDANTSSNASPSAPKDKGKGKERAPLFSEEDFECSICQDLTVGTSSCVPCGHTFCGGCIWDYLKAGNSTCPICRASIPSHGTRIIPNYVAENLLSKWAEATLGEDERKEWVSRKDGWLAYKLSLEDDPSFNPTSARPAAASRPYQRQLPSRVFGAGADDDWLLNLGRDLGGEDERPRPYLARRPPVGVRRRVREASSSGEEREERRDGDYRPPGEAGGSGSGPRREGRGFGSLFGRRLDDEGFPPLPPAVGSSSSSRRSTRVRIPDSPPPPPRPPSLARPSSSSSSSRSRAPPPPPNAAGPSLRSSRPILPLPRHRRAPSPPTAGGLSPRARRRLAVLGPEDSDEDLDLNLLFGAIGSPPPPPSRLFSAPVVPARPSASSSRPSADPSSVWASFRASAAASGSGSGSSARRAAAAAADPSIATGGPPSSRPGGRGGFARFGGQPSFAARAPLQRRPATAARRGGDSVIEVVDLISD